MPRPKKLLQGRTLQHDPAILTNCQQLVAKITNLKCPDTMSYNFLCLDGKAREDKYILVS